jgi:hypothetical protein
MTQSATTTATAAAPSAAELDAARLLLARLGVAPADLLRPEPDRAPAPTFAEYVPLVRDAVSSGTRRVYGSYLKRIVEHWGTRRLDEPTPSEIHQLAEHLKANVVMRRSGRGGRGATEHLIAALRCLYRYAENDGHLTAADNPARKVAKPRRLPSTATGSPSCGCTAWRKDVVLPGRAGGVPRTVSLRALTRTTADLNDEERRPILAAREGRRTYTITTHPSATATCETQGPRIEGSLRSARVSTLKQRLCIKSPDICPVSVLRAKAGLRPAGSHFSADCCRHLPRSAHALGRGQAALEKVPLGGSVIPPLCPPPNNAGHRGAPAVLAGVGSAPTATRNSEVSTASQCSARRPSRNR